ncbi:MAG: hypothetical protein KC910_05910 [Candidatus Eremiobacteraeota bacterium]|nr:hypothetical protein [Candidatus Eremiobacteraeota bacterium]
MNNEIGRIRTTPQVYRAQGQAPAKTGQATDATGTQPQSDVAEIGNSPAPAEPKTASLNISFRVPAATLAATGGLAGLTAAFVLDSEVDQVGRTWQPEGQGKIVAGADVLSVQANPAEEGVAHRYLGVAVGEDLIAKHDQHQPLYFDADGNQQAPKTLTEAMQGLGELGKGDAEVHFHLDVPAEIVEGGVASTLALIPSDELRPDGTWQPGQGSQAWAPDLYVVNLSNKPEDGTGVAHMAVRGTVDEINAKELEDVEPLAQRALTAKNRTEAVELTEKEPLSRGRLEDMGFTPESAVDGLKAYVETLEAHPEGLPAEWAANPENRKLAALFEFVSAAGTVANARQQVGHLAVESAKVAIANGTQPEAEDMHPAVFAALKPKLEMVMGKTDPFNAWNNVKATGERTTMHSLDNFARMLAPRGSGQSAVMGSKDLTLLATARYRAELLQKSVADRPEAAPFARVGVNPENLTLGDLKRQSDMVLEGYQASQQKGPLHRFAQRARDTVFGAVARVTAGPVAAAIYNTDKMAAQEHDLNHVLETAISKADEGDLALASWLQGELAPKG